MSILIRELTEYEKDSDEQCRRCKRNCSFEGMGGTWQCYGFVPKTNRDKLNNMSNKELAEWFVIIAERQLNHVRMRLPTEEEKVEARKAWLKWLRQECES